MNDIRNFVNKNNNNNVRQARVSLDVNSLEDMNCIKCGNQFYINYVRMKKLPATLSPNGQEGQVQINIIQCAECGWLFDPKKWDDHQNIINCENVTPINKEELKNEAIRMVEGLESKIRKKEIEEEEKEICRKCGEFYKKGIEHICNEKA